MPGKRSDERARRASVQTAFEGAARERHGDKSLKRHSEPAIALDGAKMGSGLITSKGNLWDGYIFTRVRLGFGSRVVAMAENVTKRVKKRERDDGLMRTVSLHHFHHAGDSHRLTISCSEVMQEEYGLYVWPCSIVLAEYVWQNRLRFAGARVIELGAGTALPGIVAAKLGASVVLTDREDQPQVFENMQTTCGLNQVSCEMQGLTWGQWDEKSFALRHPAQIVLGADVLYASKDFDDLLATVKFLLQGMPESVFITTYQPRSGHRSIEYLMAKWGLQCTQLLDAADFLPASKLSALSNSVELVEIRSQD